jgi:NAD(P)-dependent dehydrogenase (short-subunit alcohol dehydrogenase family)
VAEVHDVPVRHDEADMAHPAEIAALVERTARAFGPCDILVNNAGIQHVCLVAEHCWDPVGLAIADHAYRFERLGARASGRG